VRFIDGIFSMRGDCAPIDQIVDICKGYDSKFKDGVITVVDDSHGMGAYGDTGRGTPEHCQAWPDIVVGTFGKAFGVNGGFIAASDTIVEAIRQKADTYIYTNPLSVADCAAAISAIDICDSKEGLLLLNNGILVVGLTFPVVPKGDETIRFQIIACHTAFDIESTIELLDRFTYNTD